MVNNGISVIPVILALIGLIFSLGTLLDYPKRSEFSEEGVLRVAILRRHQIEWSQIEQLERTNPFLIGRRFRRDREGPGEEPSPPRGGGLVAVKGGRRYLLTNAREGRSEFDRLNELVVSVAPHVRIWARRPSEAAAPSNLYRRNH